MRYQAHVCRSHYLLEVDPKGLIGDALKHTSVPGWGEGHLRTSPFVVVRSGLAPVDNIPIGVRGTDRNQRWPALCHPKWVKRVIAPPQLVGRGVPTSRADAIPALRSLPLLETRWMDLDRPWGPGGSVGFELATGSYVAKPESDLDIVMYAETPMSADEAKCLCARAADLPAAVDIRVETPGCGFSLWEYARESPAVILLHTTRGVLLGRNPWQQI